MLEEMPLKFGKTLPCDINSRLISITLFYLGFVLRIVIQGAREMGIGGIFLWFRGREVYTLVVEAAGPMNGYRGP